MPAETRRTPPVFVQPFVEEGLGNTAYLVGARDSKVGALIDPLRDVDRYLEAADGLGVKIAVALDTHLHNDLVSGPREVAARTGAIVGAGAAGRRGARPDPPRQAAGRGGVRAACPPGPGVVPRGLREASSREPGGPRGPRRPAGAVAALRGRRQRVGAGRRGRPRPPALAGVPPEPRARRVRALGRVPPRDMGGLAPPIPRTPRPGRRRRGGSEGGRPRAHPDRVR